MCSTHTHTHPKSSLSLFRNLFIFSLSLFYLEHCFALFFFSPLPWPHLTVFFFFFFLMCRPSRRRSGQHERERGGRTVHLVQSVRELRAILLGQQARRRCLLVVMVLVGRTRRRSFVCIYTFFFFLILLHLLCPRTFCVPVGSWRLSHLDREREPHQRIQMYTVSSLSLFLTILLSLSLFFSCVYFFCLLYIGKGGVSGQRLSFSFFWLL